MSERREFKWQPRREGIPRNLHELGHARGYNQLSTFIAMMRNFLPGTRSQHEVNADGTETHRHFPVGLLAVAAYLFQEGKNWPDQFVTPENFALLVNKSLKNKKKRFPKDFPDFPKVLFQAADFDPEGFLAAFAKYKIGVEHSDSPPKLDRRRKHAK